MQKTSFAFFLVLLFVANSTILRSQEPLPKTKTRADCLKILAEEPMFWSRIGFAVNPPRLDASGKPPSYKVDIGVSAREHAAFEKAGAKVATTILHSGWVGIDRYDYTLVDETLDLLLKDYPERYYMPRIKMEPPAEWLRENPEDLFVTYHAPRDEEGIRELANKMSDYWGTDGWAGNVPLKDGLVGPQSHSSRKWKTDAGEALRRLLEHLENGPYGDRIVGYHLAFGSCGETSLWGSWRKRNEFKGDFGINHRKEFFRWCLEKYGTLEALREVWGRPDLDESNFEIPFLFDLEPEKKSLEQFFRVGKKNRSKIDYGLFSADITADAAEYFGSIAKKTTGGKPVGYFYGYLYVQDMAYAGHLAIGRLLESPHIDFLCAPKAYYRSAAGQPGGEQGPSLSIMRKKLWLDELDNRTHLSGESYAPKSMDETRTILWREVAKNLSYQNQNWWWMDLHGGWFDDDAIMSEIAKLIEVDKAVRLGKRESVAEILYVIDDESLFYLDTNRAFTDGSECGILIEMEMELKLAGTPVETYRLSDLHQIPLDRYKLIVMGNTFRFGKGEWNRIEARIPKTTTVVWNYAAGILAPEYSPKNVKEITGFEIKPCLEASAPVGYNIKHDLPLLEIVPEDGLEILKRYSEGGILAATKTDREGRKVVLCANPYLKAVDFRRIAEEAGCHFYAPVNCTVYADNRFAAVFPMEAIRADLRFKNKMNRVVDEITGKTWSDVVAIPVSLDAKSALFLRFDP